MNISEHDLLERYLAAEFPNSKTFTNVPLGEIDDWKHERMKRVTRKRADAVVIKDDKIFIIEAKLKPKPEGIGQLLVYQKILFDTPKFSSYKDLPIILIYLTTRSDPDIEEVCYHHGIYLMISNPD